MFVTLMLIPRIRTCSGFDPSTCRRELLRSPSYGPGNRRWWQRYQVLASGTWVVSQLWLEYVAHYVARHVLLMGYEALVALVRVVTSIGMPKHQG